MIKRIFSWSILLFLVLWASTATYFSVNDMNLLNFIKEKLFSQKSVVADIKKDYIFITDFFEKYYHINGRSSIKQRNKKLRLLHDILMSSKQKKALDKYKEHLEYLSRKKGIQSFTLHKILRNKKTGVYTSFLSLKKDIQPKNEFLVKVDLMVSTSHNIKKSETYSKKYHILYWDEMLLTIPPKNFFETNVYSGADTLSLVKIPCPISSISSSGLKEAPHGSNIEITRGTSSQVVKFYSKNNISKSNEFKIDCPKMIFNVQLTHSDDFLTVYQFINPSNGIQKKRRLSRKEKLKKDIERLFEVKVEIENN